MRARAMAAAVRWLCVAFVFMLPTLCLSMLPQLDSYFDGPSSDPDGYGSNAPPDQSSTPPPVADSIPGEDDDDDDDESVNLGDEGTPRFCNKTTTFTIRTECKPCGMNSLVTCPSGLRQLTQGRGVADCSFAQRLDFISVIYLAGCRHTCEKTATIPVCCTGFWGNDCQECPGGFQSPCTGHGSCLDGLYGNGACICTAAFTGVACEQCKPNFYGQQCNRECQCVNGICDSGINGTGLCECNSGFMGPNCERSVVNCESLACPNNSRCLTTANDTVKCFCNYGYEEDENKLCQPINQCVLDPNPCHPKALCVPTGPGSFECSCMAGYDGDGFVCIVSDPCQKDYGGCPVDSTRCLFVGPGQRTCECFEGYENYVDGDGCQLIDACAVNRTLCHENANCTTTGPWEVECVCSAGYIGDGQNCYGNIYERINSLHSSDPEFKNRFQYAVRLASDIYTDALTKHGPFTLFLPTDEGIRKSLTTRELQDVFADKEIARQLVRQHIIAAQLTLADLGNSTAFYMLEGSSAELFYKNKELKFRLHDYSLKANVLKGDLIAANGIIHIIDLLLDKPPVTMGSTKKSISFILSTSQRFSRFNNFLKAVNLTDKLRADGHYTIFAPSSVSWNSLPQGTFDYFLSTEGKGKLIEILENHIISGPYLLASDLINTPRFTAIGGLANEVAVSAVGRIQFNGVVNLTQADIPASNGYIHSIDGLLLPEAILPVLPHRCDLVTYRSVRGTCGLCSGDLKCPWTTDIPLNDTIPGCRYWVNLGEGRIQNYVAFSGCHKMCNRTYTVVRCCEGFYGSTCHPCPGGFQNPCRGRGKCKDGYYGNGECTCDPLYTGAECEFCANRNMYGPNCTLTCSCLHGTCDNRVSGSVGFCKPYSCSRNYTGASCDSQIQFCDKKLRLKCHAFADCIRLDLKSALSQIMAGKYNGSRTVGILENLNKLKIRNLRKSLQRRASCKCRQGYQGSGSYCVEIDPCKDVGRGGCHAQADCVKTGPGQNLCRCSKGFVGDGYYCYPSSPCQNDSHCDDNAVCVKTLSFEYACTCSDGYHGNGTYCVPDNVCLEDNGGCHGNASCVAVGPGLANCTCDSGLGGDGYDCFGSIAHEIRVESQLQHLGRFLQSLPPSVGMLLSDLDANYTLLAPSAEALSTFFNSTTSGFWNDDGNLFQLLNYHIIPLPLSLADIRSQCRLDRKIMTMSDDRNFELRCRLTDQDIYFNDAKVIAGDNPALNGMIHIIDKVLEPYSSVSSNLRLSDALQKTFSSSDFATSLSETGLVDEINELNGFTLFFPVGSNVQKQRKQTMKFYVIPFKLSTWKLRTLNGQRLTTMLGNGVQQQLVVTVVEDKLYINSLAVIEPSNVAVSNGFIHALGGTLNPVLNHCDVLSTDEQLEEHCCRGYYGVYCEECPGGAEFPCSGRGTCSDDIEGQGACECNSGYGGDACSICVDDTCRLDACNFNNGGCHKFADCNVTDEGTSSCACRSGYYGDGLTCRSMCDDGNNGGCPYSAQCKLSELGDVQCFCSDGYEMRNDACTYVANDCSISNGGCSSHAVCALDDDEDNITCSCLEAYVGDGYSCYGDLWQTLGEIPEISNFFKMAKDDLALKETLQEPSFYWTAFVPFNKYFTINDSLVDLAEYFTNETVFYLRPESTEDGNIGLKSLGDEEIHISCKWNEQPQCFANGVPVIRSNIELKNGVLHILERPFLLASAHQSSAELLSQAATGTSPWVLAFLLIIVLALVIFVVVMIFQKRERLLMYINQRFPSGQFSFCRFTERDPSQALNVVTFNPAVNYEQDEDGDFNLSSGDIFPDMLQHAGQDDQQQLL